MSKRVIRYTIFDNVWPKKKNVHAHKMTWEKLVAFVQAQDEKLYADKKNCPLISLCSYGTKPSTKGYLRHGGNVRRVYGIELDYDDGKMTPEEAKDRFQTASIKAVIYTSPSYTPEFPKWRALLPLSKPLAPDRRAEMVGKANRVLGGVVARESFTLSQSFYIGHVKKAEYEVYESKGLRCIDQHKVKPLPAKGSNKDGKGGAFDETPDGVFIDAYEKGEGRYDATLALTSRWISRGRDPDKVREELHKLVRLAEHDGIKPVTDHGENLYKTINRLVDSAVAKFGAKRHPVESSKRAAFDWQDASRVLATEPKQQQYLIEGWFTFPSVGLYAAHGGSGKSYVALEIAARVALGMSVFGRDVKPGRVLYVSAEDDLNAMHYRLQRITTALGVESGKLKDKLFLSDATQADTILFRAPQRFGEKAKLTARYKRLREDISTLEPVLVILDNAVDHFSGNENDRVQVRAFMRKLARLTQQGSGCCVLLIAHVDAASVKDGKDAKGYSGSTAWHNSARVVWYQYPESDYTSSRLVLRKINYSKRGLQVEIQWDDERQKFEFGKTLDPISTVNRCALRVLRVLAALEDTGEWLYRENVKNNCAGKVLAHPECPKELKRDKSAVRGVIKKLREDGLITEVERLDKERKKRKVIALTEQGRRHIEGATYE